MKNEFFLPVRQNKSNETRDYNISSTKNIHSVPNISTTDLNVLIDSNPTLLSGLVVGDDPNKPIFLPAEDDTGEFQFVEIKDDIRKFSTPHLEEEILY